jgi:hypothetical protein
VSNSCAGDADAEGCVFSPDSLGEPETPTIPSVVSVAAAATTLYQPDFILWYKFHLQSLHKLESISQDEVVYKCQVM